MRMLLCVSICLPIFAYSALSRADDAEEIKKLIPAAAAMAQADFEKLATSPSPKASDVEEKSLTLLLFSAQLRDDAKSREQFRYLTKGPPKPAQLSSEMYRKVLVAGAKGVLAPVTMIHADRITKLTCEVNERTAKGTVSFEAPKLYAGQVNYVARKVDGNWRIEEFSLPTYKIHTVRGENGKWREK